METIIDIPAKLILDILAQVSYETRGLEAVAYAPVHLLAELLEKGTDEVTYTICLFVQFFSCLGLSVITSVPVRKMYSTTTGFLIFTYFFGVGIVPIMFVNLTAFVLYSILPRTQAAIAMTVWTFAAMIGSSMYNYLTTTQEIGGHG